MQKTKVIRVCSDMRAHLIDREQDFVKTLEIESAEQQATLDVEKHSPDERKKLMVTAA
jgi:hypothetical protein